jgi:hypothetical protein
MIGLYTVEIYFPMYQIELSSKRTCTLSYHNYSFPRPWFLGVEKSLVLFQDPGFDPGFATSPLFWKKWFWKWF